MFGSVELLWCFTSFFYANFMGKETLGITALLKCVNYTIEGNEVHRFGRLGLRILTGNLPMTTDGSGCFD